MSSVLTLTPFQHSLLTRLAAGIRAHQSDLQAFMSLLLIMLVLETLDVDPAAIESIFGAETAALFQSLIAARAGRACARLAQDCLPASAADPVLDSAAIDFAAIVRAWAEERQNAVLR
jgi:hypothetical protein